MKIKISIGLLALFTLQACSEKPNKIQEQISTTNEKPTYVSKEIKASEAANNENEVKHKTKYTCDDCVQLVKTLIKKSSYDSYFKSKYESDYSIVIDEATKEKIRIQIVLVDKNPNNTPMGWLELDLISEKLKDITNDIENPEEVKADIALIKEFKNNCMECCTD